jgi:hypothetical protein
MGEPLSLVITMEAETQGLAIKKYSSRQTPVSGP